MSLRVEERSAGEHMKLWSDLLGRTRAAPMDGRLLAWRYLENPQGRARTWVLVDNATGAVGGFSTVIPRRMRRGDRELLAWIGADFSILPRYRALGPALQLRRAARIAIDAGDADLLYSFPNERMALIHERAGHVRLGDLQRYARPASARPHLERLVSPRLLAALLALPVDLALRLLPARAPRGVNQVAEITPAAFDARFDALAERAAPPGRLFGARDAAYLRWRYSAQPGWRGGVLAAQREGRLSGYLVFTEESGLLKVSDLLSEDDAATAALLTHAARIATRRGCASTSFVVLERSLAQEALLRHGFRAREETHAVYAYVPARHAQLVDSQDPERWHLTMGDKDI